MRVLAEQALRLLLDERHARLAAHEDHLVHRGELRVVHALAARLARAVHEIHRELLELRLVQRGGQVLRARRVRRDERKRDVVGRGAGERALRLLGLLLQTLERHHVVAEVDAVLRLEVLDEPLHDGLVEVVAAEVRVAVRGLHLKDAVADVEDRDIERAAAEVVYGDLLVLLLVEAVRERCRRGLVHDALHVKARDAAGVLRRLALRVVEVRRHGDDRLGDLLAEERLRVRLQLLQDHRADFLRTISLIAHLHRRVAVRGRNDLVRDHLALGLHLVVTTAHEALDRVNGGFRVRHGLTLRRLADETLARLRERHDGRRGALAFRVRNHRRFATFHHSHAAVRGAQVYA